MSILYSVKSFNFVPLIYDVLFRAKRTALFLSYYIGVLAFRIRFFITSEWTYTVSYIYIYMMTSAIFEEYYILRSELRISRCSESVKRKLFHRVSLARNGPYREFSRSLYYIILYCTTHAFTHWCINIYYFSERVQVRQNNIIRTMYIVYNVAVAETDFSRRSFSKSQHTKRTREKIRSARRHNL